MQRYERFRDEAGKRQHISEDTKLAALEALVPTRIRAPAGTRAALAAECGQNTGQGYEAVREEVQIFMETRRARNSARTLLRARQLLPDHGTARGLRRWS